MTKCIDLILSFLNVMIFESECNFLRFLRVYVMICKLSKLGHSFIQQIFMSLDYVLGIKLGAGRWQ